MYQPVSSPCIHSKITELTCISAHSHHATSLAGFDFDAVDNIEQSLSELSRIRDQVEGMFKDIPQDKRLFWTIGTAVSPSGPVYVAGLCYVEGQALPDVPQILQGVFRGQKIVQLPLMTDMIPE